MVARDHAGKAATLGRAGNVDELSDRERLDAHGFADLERGKFFRGDRKFLEQLARLDPGLGQMPGLRLVDAARTALAVGHLDRGVAIRFQRLDLRDAVVRHVEHRHRDGGAVFGKRQICGLDTRDDRRGGRRGDVNRHRRGNCAGAGVVNGKRKRGTPVARLASRGRVDQVGNVRNCNWRVQGDRTPAKEKRIRSAGRRHIN